MRSPGKIIGPNGCLVGGSSKLLQMAQEAKAHLHRDVAVLHSRVRQWAPGSADVLVGPANGKQFDTRDGNGVRSELRLPAPGRNAQHFGVQKSKRFERLHY